MNEHPATLLRCVVERITYQNPENGYSVLKVKVKGYSDLVTLVGNLLEVPVGSVLLCRGEWKVDKCYGSQGHRPPVRPGYRPAIRNGDHRHHRDGDRTALRSSEHRT